MGEGERERQSEGDRARARGWGGREGERLGERKARGRQGWAVRGALLAVMRVEFVCGVGGNSPSTLRGLPLMRGAGLVSACMNPLPPPMDAVGGITS